MIPLASSIAIVLTVAVCLPNPADAQCAMCRSVLASPEGQQLVAAFRHGILFLLAAPFAVFGTVAFLAVRRQRRRMASSHGGPPTLDT